MVFATNKHMGNPALITEAAMVNKELSGQEMCRRASCCTAGYLCGLVMELKR